MKEKLRNKKVVYTIIGIVSVLLVALAVTYAYWLVTKTQENENVISSACLDISISGEKNDIMLTNQFPMSDEDGMKLVPYEFTVTNNCNTSVDYQISLEAIGDSSNALSATSLKVALDDSAKLYSAYSSVETTIDGAYESRKLGVGTLSSTGNEGSTATYNLRIWIDENAPISEMNKTFKSRISVTIGQGITNPIKEGTLAYNILSNVGGEGEIDEIDTDAWNHEIKYTRNEYISSASNFYYGTEYIFDKKTNQYTLSGEIVQATLTECRNGTKVCGKYTLKNTSSTYSNRYLYEITDFQSSGNYVTANTLYAQNAFSKGTTADEAGLYKTQDDLGDTYYFRGAPQNNYVQFGTYNSSIFVNNYNRLFESSEECEKIRPTTCEYSDDLGMYTDNNLNAYETIETCEEAVQEYFCKEQKNMFWRIVRINGDGTVRLIYAGATDDENNMSNVYITGKSAYNSNYDNKKYVGYTYDDGNGMQVDSTIKSVVDAWYDTHLKANYGDKIADSIFCNDRSEASKTYYDENYSTITDPNAAVYADIIIPSLKCINKNDRYTVNDTINGNGLLSNPIGLITADEIIFSGNPSFEKNAISYWTMTPAMNVSIWNFTIEAGLDNVLYTLQDNSGVRPVINLKADVKFTGDGTIDNPYKIVTE